MVMFSFHILLLFNQIFATFRIFTEQEICILEYRSKIREFNLYSVIQIRNSACILKYMLKNSKMASVFQNTDKKEE